MISQVFLRRRKKDLLFHPPISLVLWLGFGQFGVEIHIYFYPTSNGAHPESNILTEFLLLQV